jgi:hypothetical protein
MYRLIRGSTTAGTASSCDARLPFTAATATLASNGVQLPALTSLPNPPVPPPASAPSGTPITHVGKYTLYETIGEGAFGKVKLGINRETSERVAVKIMDKKEIREQDLSAQVRREIYIMRSLSHKHIVRMYEVLTSNTKLYIVMELVTGGHLYTKCGTQDYCASEIIERADEGYNGAKVDTWS